MYCVNLGLYALGIGWPLKMFAEKNKQMCALGRLMW